MLALPAPAARPALPAPAATIRVVAMPEPFRTSRVRHEAPLGASLADILEELQPAAELRSMATMAVERGGEVWIVPRSAWPRVRPRAGTRVVVRVVPRDPVSLIAGLGALAGPVLSTSLVGATVFGTALGATAAAVIGGVVSLGLTLAARALVRPQKPPKIEPPESAAPAYSVSGARNREDPFGPVPQVLGTRLVFPRYHARWWTESAGDEEYLWMLFAWSVGPVELTGPVMVGDTPLTSMAGHYHHHRPGRLTDGVHGFPSVYQQESLQLEFTDDLGQWHTRGVDDADRIILEFLIPELRGINPDGSDFPTWIWITCECRPLSGGAWANVGSVHFEARLLEPARRQVAFYPPVLDAGRQYEVRCRRVSWSDDGAPPRVYRQQCYWTAIKAVEHTNPEPEKRISTSIMRIQASNQVNGPVDRVSAVVTTIAHDYDYTSGAWIERATNNPASLFRHVLQGQANLRPLTDAQLDLPSLEAWHDFCRVHGFSFNHVVDGEVDIWDLLVDIAAAGRATPGAPNGLLGVIVDEPRVAPSQAFSPRNSWGFQAEKTFVEHPDALRVPFVNGANGYDDDERIVCDDGFAEDTAEDFETLHLTGVTDAGQVYALARYHMAVARLRPETYTFWTSVRHLVSTRGDWIRVSHDVPRWHVEGGWPRVRERVTDPETGDVVGLELDDAVVMEAGSAYAIQVEMADGTLPIFSILSEVGEHHTVSLAAAVPATAAPEAGDLVLFGRAATGPARDCIIMAIEAGEDLTAKLTVADYAPEVFDAAAEIPDFVSGVTRPAFIRPAVPEVVAIASDESVMREVAGGGLVPQMVVSYAVPDGLAAVTTLVNIRARVLGSTVWTFRRNAAADIGTFVVPSVREGETWEVQLRSETRDVRGSAWSDSVTHVIVGKSGLPPDVPTLMRYGTDITWSYPSAPRDLAGFRLRSQPGVLRDWDTAAPLHPAGTLISSPPFNISPLLDGYTRTVLLKAVDTSGNESLGAVALTLALAGPEQFNVIETRAEHPDWAGNAEAAHREGGELRSDQTALWWAADMATEVWTPSTAGMSYQIAYEPPEEGRLTGLVDITAPDGWRLSIRERSAGAVWSGDDSVVYWTGTDAAGVWGAEPGPWVPMAGAVYVTPQPYDVLLDVMPCDGQVTVREVTLSLDVADIMERLEDVVVPSGGGRLPIAKAYPHAIRNVSLTLQEVPGEGAVTVRVVDKGLPPGIGPLVRGLDAAGADAAATVDATVVGY